MPNAQLNAVYSSRTMKRRYEVWFLRCGLVDGSGAWWFRYLLTNLGRHGCSTENDKMPVQVWATWFPREAHPQTFIQGYPADQLDLTGRFRLPFHCGVADNAIDEDSCRGNLCVEGHTVSWNLRNRSNFGATLSDKGWIGFSKSPHSDAVFSGEILFDGQRFSGDPVGFGVQGHNCGYRHRTFWRWMHAYFRHPGGGVSTVEALIYDMPFGLLFRKAVLWHKGTATILKNPSEKEIVRETGHLRWRFTASRGDLSIDACIEAFAPGIHQLPYVKTDCSGTFPVSNASLARATVRVGNETLETPFGAVLEMGGN
ncbi:MAG TPA: hypothetical protein VMT75_11695 [Candidatus Saccharimonadales bacterium]|nr:hypothetical protein [Candidatus Saccharimonadales bacterium]